MKYNLLPDDGTCYSKKSVYFRPDSIVLHYISCRYTLPADPYNMTGVRQILKRYGLSYHVLIGRDHRQGSQLLVPLNRKAWHAGKSKYNGRSDFNRFAFGVALLGMPGDKYTDFQYSELNWWIDYLDLHCLYRYRQGIPTDNIVGHEHIAADRGKVDPGFGLGIFDIQRIERPLKW